MAETNQKITELKGKALNLKERIKHFLKDPAKNAADVEAKKAASKKIMLCGGIIFVAPWVLLIIIRLIFMNILPQEIYEAIGDVLMAIMIICFIVGLIAIIIGFNKLSGLKALETKIKNLTCSGCGSLLSLNDKISYQVIRVYTTSNTETKNTSLGVKITTTQEEHTQAEVTCTCAHCGTVKTLNNSFVTAKWINGTLQYSRNIDDSIANYFTSELQAFTPEKVEN